VKPEPTTTKPGAKMRTAGTSLIQLGAEEDYPPEMRELTDNRKRFVIAYVYFAKGYHTPDGWHRSAADAARLAGLGGGPHNQRKEGAKLLRNPAVLRAVRAMDDIFLRADLPQNRRVAMAIRDNPLTKPEVRLKAAQWLDSTGGRIARTEHQVIVNHEASLSTKEIEKQLAELYRDNPRLREIEGPKEAPIEGEFSEVTNAEG
jgi:hypothetical protein